MLSITDVKGVVFDVDETLLDTGVEDPRTGLHEQARLQVTHEAGRRYNLSRLLAVTPEENVDFFMDASVHSLEGALWRMLYVTGVVGSEVIDYTNPLLLELVAGRNEAIMDRLRNHGKPVTGVVEFIDWLAAHGLAQAMAIASTARRSEIDIFLQELTNLRRFFPDERIVSKEVVTHHKPNPEAFDKAFRSLHLPDDARVQVLAFEDNPKGIASAKGAGLFTCAITTICSREKLATAATPPDLIADSFDEFRELLNA